MLKPFCECTISRPRGHAPKCIAILSTRTHIMVIYGGTHVLYLLTYLLVTSKKAFFVRRWENLWWHSEPYFCVRTTYVIKKHNHKLFILWGVRRSTKHHIINLLLFWTIVAMCFKNQMDVETVLRHLYNWSTQAPD
jgi:hypothetical protein